MPGSAPVASVCTQFLLCFSRGLLMRCRCQRFALGLVFPLPAHRTLDTLVHASLTTCYLSPLKATSSKNIPRSILVKPHTKHKLRFRPAICFHPGRRGNPDKFCTGGVEMSAHNPNLSAPNHLPSLYFPLSLVRDSLIVSKLHKEYGHEAVRTRAVPRVSPRG